MVQVDLLPSPTPSANSRDKSSLLWPRGYCLRWSDDDPGVGSRPPSKKKIANLGGYTRGGGGVESCIIDDEHNQPLFTEFFFMFYQDIAITKVYCFKLKT